MHDTTAAIMPKPKRLAKRMFKPAGTFLSNKKWGDEPASPKKAHGQATKSRLA